MEVRGTACRVRRKHDGKYLIKQGWAKRGRIYRSIKEAKSAAKVALSQGVISSLDTVEVVEHLMVEREVHPCE